MTPTCVAFDLGGVLVRYHAQWSGTLVAAGYPARNLGTLADFPLTHELGRDAISFEEYCSGLVSYLGVPDVAAAALVHNSILIGEYEGATDLVIRLRTAGIKVGALTNNNHEHLKGCMERIPVCRELDAVVASCNVGFNKPSEGIYRAFERIMDSKPDEIVLFDDVVENVDGGKICGWNAVLIDPSRETKPQIESVLANLGLLF